MDFKVLTIEVYKCGLGDFSLHGITEKNNALVMLVGDEREDESPNYDAAIAYCRKYNIGVEKAIILNKRILWGEKHYYLEPIIKPKNMIQVSGGAFGYTWDSRFKEITGCAYPIPFHDRFETQEMYDALSL